MLDKLAAALIRRHLRRASDGTIELQLDCDHGMRVTVPLTADDTGCEIVPGLFLGDVTISRVDAS